MIILVKSLNKGVFWKAWITHWALFDENTKIYYSYEYEIVRRKFVNPKVKKYTEEQYFKNVKEFTSYTPLFIDFDLNKYMGIQDNEFTCIDFCLFVMWIEKVNHILLYKAYQEYYKVTEEIKKTWMSHFIIFILWLIIWIISIIAIMMMLFDFNFVNNL
jgi:hypothetical protein